MRGVGACSQRPPANILHREEICYSCKMLYFEVNCPEEYFVSIYYVLGPVFPSITITMKITNDLSKHMNK